MKNDRWFINGLFITAIILCIVIYLPRYKSIEVNNTLPASEIITVNHDLRKLLLAEAIFYVENGFDDVYAMDFAHCTGITLECKRQATSTQFYYVIYGDSYWGYIIVDDNDVIRDILIQKDFPTIQETKECLAEIDNLHIDIDLTEVPKYLLDRNWRTCGYSTGFWHRLFTLQDGMLIMKEPYPLNNDPIEYYYYTDSEWKSEHKQWNGYVILPIDKQIRG